MRGFERGTERVFVFDLFGDFNVDLKVTFEQSEIGLELIFQ